MGKKVAVRGETVATASPRKAPSTNPAWKGTWTAGPVTETSYGKLSVRNVKVIHEANCTFSFSGLDTSVSPTPPSVFMTSDLKLSATTKILQKGASFVLVDGDQLIDTHGNRLRVGAAGHLTTA
jgi:hypothetical protein